MATPLGLDPQTWARLSPLLDEALELPVAQRAAWLDGLAAEHAPLKERLRELLIRRGGVETSEVLRTLPKFDEAASDGRRAGDVVGGYRLVRELGAGGMGSVWEAVRVDGLIARPVALKLPLQSLHREDLAERIARERGFLAALNHPHIARLYDAGIADGGQPYLALEHVQGERIDRWCEARSLDVRARLGLFLQAARAVSHAHSHLIVHRDLKPSNLLVDAAGQVKLLDFGIARLLEDGEGAASALTQEVGRVLTPDYASPEQIAGDAAGTRSDVYSLGVLLYELLAGTRPYRLKRDSRGALEDAILDAEPPRPSQVAPAGRRKILQGDLDTIVLKALKKQPQDRYASVDAFGDDLERWLDGRPVLARPDSRWYRASRFATRHRVAVGAAATAFAAVLAGAGLAVWQAGESRQQRDAALRARGHADRQAEAAELARRIADANAELADFLLADLSAGRSAQQMEQQLERAIVAVRARHAGDARVRTQLLINLAGRFRQLGNFARQRALMAELEVSARAIDDPLALGRLLCWRARDSVFDGRIAQARELIAQARRELARAAHVPTGHRTSCLADESAIARLAGDGARAVAAIEEAVQLERQAGLARTESHADSLFSLARAYGQSGRFREAVDAAQHSLDLRRDLGQAGSAGMANVRTIMATLLRDGGRVDLALAALDALRAADRVPSATLAFHHAATLVEAGRLGEALPMLARVQQEAKDLNDRTTARAAAMARVSALAARGTLDEARRVLADAEVLYDELRAERSYGVRRLLAARIDLALAADDVPAAERGLGELDGLLEGLGNASDPAWRAAHGQAARVALKQQRFERALQRAEAALALANRQAIDPERSVFVGEALLLRARARQGLGDAGGSARDAAAAAWHLQARGAAPAAGAP